MDGGSLIHQFQNITDPRIDRTKQHLLIDIIVIAICAVVGGADGADGFDAIEVFGVSHEQWFHKFLKLPNMIDLL